MPPQSPDWLLMVIGPPEFPSRDEEHVPGALYESPASAAGYVAYYAVDQNGRLCYEVRVPRSALSALLFRRFCEEAELCAGIRWGPQLLG